MRKHSTATDRRRSAVARRRKSKRRDGIDWKSGDWLGHGSVTLDDAWPRHSGDLIGDATAKRSETLMSMGEVLLGIGKARRGVVQPWQSSALIG